MTKLLGVEIKKAAEELPLRRGPRLLPDEYSSKGTMGVKRFLCRTKRS
jgi:hypothetical protein